MRITILNQFYTPDLSPTAHLSASLAKHRAAKGDQVSIVASRGGYVEASPDQLKSDRGNPRVHRIWTPRLGKATVLKRCIDYATFYVLAAWRLLTLPGQDVIVTLTTPPYIAWAAVLHSWLHPRTRIVMWNMDCYPELAERSEKLNPKGLPSRAMRWMNRALFRRIDHLVCLDTAMVDLLMGQYAPKKKTLPVTVIPNWEEASFFPDPGERPRAEDAFVVLYLGNMGYGHRFETVVDAAEILKHEPVIFRFIGGGSRFDGVKEAAAQRGLTNITMQGYVPKEQTPGVMAGADVALITLRDEILGVMSPSKLHSNLAARLPIIYVGPKTSNVDDAIREFSCGVSLRHGPSSEIVEFVRRMMREPQTLRDLRAKARSAFDLAYNDRVTLPKFDGVIDGLARGAAGATPARASANQSEAA